MNYGRADILAVLTLNDHVNGKELEAKLNVVILESFSSGSVLKEAHIMKTRRTDKNEG